MARWTAAHASTSTPISVSRTDDGCWATTRPCSALVTSANVACGFHAGDPGTLLATVTAAADSGVVVGAQVSYPDLAGFGRRFIDMESADLTAAVLYQIGALDGLCRAAGTRVRYVKPHGALYNAIVHHRAQAAAVIAAVRAYDPSLPLLGLPGSVVLDLAADAGLTIVREAFADRAYTADGTLVPRTRPGAVLQDPDLVAGRVVRLLLGGLIEAEDGSDIAMVADSVCLHGDSFGAVAMARAVRSALADNAISVQPFVDPVR